MAFSTRNNIYLRYGRIQYFVIVTVMASLVSALFIETTLDSLPNMPLPTLFDNAPFTSGIDANVLLIFHVTFVISVFLMTISIRFTVPIVLSTTTIIIGSLIGRFRGEPLDAVNLTNEIGLSGLEIIGGVFSARARRRSAVRF